MLCLALLLPSLAVLAEAASPVTLDFLAAQLSPIYGPVRPLGWPHRTRRWRPHRDLWGQAGLCTAAVNPAKNHI